MEQLQENQEKMMKTIQNLRGRMKAMAAQNEKLQVYLYLLDLGHLLTCESDIGNYNTD